MEIESGFVAGQDIPAEYGLGTFVKVNWLKIVSPAKFRKPYKGILYKPVKKGDRLVLIKCRTPQFDFESNWLDGNGCPRRTMG